MKQRIGVSFAVNDSYASHLEIALYSLFKHNMQHAFDIYILVSQLTDRSKRRLKEVCRQHGNATIEFMILDERMFEGFRTYAHFSKDIYSRYLLPKLLPDRDRILYLDADILVTGDILDLYQFDLGANYVAAAKDIGIQKQQFKSYMDSLSLDGGNYFNSGVLVMNLQKMRADKKVEELFEITASYGDDLWHPDQDAINIVFKNSIKELPRKWNYQDEDRKIDPTNLETASVIHYTTEKKPWNTPNVERLYNQKAHEKYEKYEYEYYNKFGYSPKVSVVLPVYNTKEEYLEKAIQSVIGQVYENIEIILVDDGSDTSTAKYLDEISNTDARIRVIHTENAGTNRARQTGVLVSEGEFITFVDSDDIIERNMIQKLMRANLKYKTEMVVCEFWANDTPRTSSQSREITTLKGVNAVSRCRYNGFPGMRAVGVVWGKLYVRSILENIDWDFCDYAVTEDEFMNIQIYSQVHVAALVPDQLYYYRQQVLDSKESNFPVYNRYLGKKIPMLQTVGNLYSQSIDFYIENQIAYSQPQLIENYIAILQKQIKQLVTSGNLNAVNLQELENQKQDNLNDIISMKELTEIQKVAAIVTFSSPEYIDLVASLEGKYQTLVANKKVEIAKLQADIDALRREKQQFMGVKRSARLLLGNIRRKARNL